MPGLILVLGDNVGTPILHRAATAVNARRRIDARHGFQSLEEPPHGPLMDGLAVNPADEDVILADGLALLIEADRAPQLALLFQDLQHAFAKRHVVDLARLTGEILAYSIDLEHLVGADNLLFEDRWPSGI